MSEQEPPAERPEHSEHSAHPEHPEQGDHGTEDQGARPPRGGSRVTVLATAATVLLGVVLGLALWAGLTGEPQRPASRERDSADRPPVGSVDWTRLAHPLQCGRLAVRLLDVEVADVTGDGADEAVVLLRCDAGAGSPPSALFVYDRAPRPGALPEPAYVLLRERDDVLLSALDVKGGAISGDAYRYSGPDVPRCCPDEYVRLTWSWTGSGFDRTSEPLGQPTDRGAQGGGQG